jgi:acyl phosphate:glycerol-3-phosphate acyltransferase
MMMGLLAIVLAYVIGGIPFGYLLVRWKTGQDVRTMGSGNIGATNVVRTTGRTVGIVTLLLDIAKGWVAVWLAALLTHSDIAGMSAAALAVILGHAYPVMLKFKGGKAVASFIGAFLYLSPLALLAVLLVFILVVWRSRFISLGSIIAAGTLPLAVYLIQHPPFPVLAASLLSGAFIVYRHRPNIQRLREGSEHAFSFGGKRT